jgi:hypothetical protein
MEVGEWSASYSKLFYPWGKPVSIHCTGDRVGTRACLDMVVRIKNLLLLGIKPWLYNL